MIDGTYAVEAKTPLGKQGGQIVLATEGDVCTADLSIAGKTKRLEGTLSGEEVTFTGSIKLPFPIGEQDFVLTGTVEGDDLKGVCTTKKLKFDITGTRVA